MSRGEDTRADFILADAKDADMAGGLNAMGLRRGAGGHIARFRSRAEFMAEIRRVIAQDVVDIVLTSASNMQALVAEDAFGASRIQPAVRLNDTSDLWRVRGASYGTQPSTPFRSASLHGVPAALGLYSMTFNGDATRDCATLEQFRLFRDHAAAQGVTYFLEIFNPGEGRIEKADFGVFLNDMVTRLLAGLRPEERPAFLKIPFNGTVALKELCAYDPGMVVGIMGGGGGAARDCFELLHQAQRCGARAALFGRKIIEAEDPVAMISTMRGLLDGRYDPAGAVRAYHESLNTAGVESLRSLENDLAVTEPVLLAGAA